MYSCNITIRSNGGNATFPVSVTIGGPIEPSLRFNPSSHDFGNMYPDKKTSTTFEIWNEYNNTLTYSLSENCGWVDISPSSGNSTGEHDTITVNIDTTGLSIGKHSCNISITSNGGNGVFTVTVTILEPKPCLRFSPHEYHFGPLYQNETGSTSFEIWNGCQKTLEYSLVESCEWVSISPMQGESTGEHDTITVEIDTSGLTVGVHTCDVNIISNGGNGTFTVTVNIIEEKPVIKIVRPEPNTFYFKDVDLFSNQMFTNPIVIGPITIKVNVTDPKSNLERIDFFIDNKPKYNTTEPPYKWTWNERAFFKHTIIVVASYGDGTSADDSLSVFIINFARS